MFTLIVTYAGLGTLITGAVGVVLAIRNHRRQVNAQIFLDLSSRYETVMKVFPAGTWVNRLADERDLPPRGEALTAAILSYLALVSFSHVLYDRGYLSEDLWAILQAELRRTLGAPLFAREWASLRNEFAMLPKFIRHVDSLQPVRSHRTHLDT